MKRKKYKKISLFLMILNGLLIERREELLSFSSYQEVYNTFSSVGFMWQDKEFRLAKLKANYIYDPYMSTSEAIAKARYKQFYCLYL
jgi:hypothetical protein